MSNKIAFIGLGVMGYPMAGHLHKAGLQVTVFNRTPDKAANWVQEFGGSRDASPAAAAEGADLVMTCVGNDDDVRSVALGDEGALAGMKAGSVLIDHTTASAQMAREVADEARAGGIGFVDAPLSGGQQGAENAALTIMCGGREHDYAAAETVLKIYGKAVNHLGGPGAGQLTKMVNQICVAGVLEGLAEGMAFAEKAGLDLESVIPVLASGAAGSWQMSNRHQTMIADEYDHGFAVDWMRKDLDICLREARNQGAELPLVDMVNDFYREVQEMGGGRWDTSSLFKRLRARGPE
jgi:3-hydroxyisobutyrate dehydrogenase-like beta-hydroxyacid dehydrogenase